MEKQTWIIFIVALMSLVVVIGVVGISLTISPLAVLPGTPACSQQYENQQACGTTLGGSQTAVYTCEYYFGEWIWRYTSSCSQGCSGYGTNYICGGNGGVCIEGTWINNPRCVDIYVYDDKCVNNQWVDTIKYICFTGRCENGQCVTTSICTPYEWKNTPYCDALYPRNVFDYRCDPDGIAWVPQIKQTCTTDQTCSTGQCTYVSPQICTEGEWKNEPDCVQNNVYDDKCVNGYWSNQLKEECSPNNPCKDGMCGSNWFIDNWLLILAIVVITIGVIIVVVKK